MANLGEYYSIWQVLPDSVLLHIFSFLPSRSLLNASQVCKSWHLVAMDEYLWKDLLYRTWHIDVRITMAPGKQSWLQEFKRLYYHTPQIESEVLRDHTDQVLHISFSHDGKLFATSSKDGFIKVWTSSFPTRVLYYADMREFTWKYTQYSQFNENDTLLLVSGVHFGAHSTSGEIAVFNLVDGFTLQCRVLNKPYDIFGTWYNENYLLSANLHWLGHLTSCSVLWLNKASQALESENESVVMRLYKFRNINASSIRTVMIARCSEADPPLMTGSMSVDSQSSDAESQDMDMSMKGAETSQSECSQGKSKRKENRLPISQKVQVMDDGDHGVRFVEVDDSNGEAEETIEYNNDYRMAENNQVEQQRPDEGAANMEDIEEVEDPSFASLFTDPTQEDSSSARELSRPRRRRRDETKDKRPYCETCVSPQCGDGDSSKHKASRSARQIQVNGTNNATSSTSSSSCKRPGCGRQGNGIHGPGGDINVNTNSTGNNNDSYFRLHHHPVSASTAVSSSSSHPTPFSRTPPLPTSSTHPTLFLQKPPHLPAPSPQPTPFSHKPPPPPPKSSSSSSSPSSTSHPPHFPQAPPPLPPSSSSPSASSSSPSASSSSSAPQPQPNMSNGHVNEGAFSVCNSASVAGRSSGNRRMSSCRMTGLDLTDAGDKYLIFTTGMTTYTPHQIGIKRIRSLEDVYKADVEESPEGLRHWPNGADNDVNLQRDEFDTVDHLIELHGHIIGMCLSPDHRYLYVNSRPWPQDYEIDDPLYPPPIAQEIDIHVIDLQTMHEVGTMHRAHKAYTPNDECFFIFLDVCQEYVASGAEDKHGYLWDRHYGICLTKFPHADVVNSVAFNPHDPEMLITASDDNSLKIWRSRNRERQVKGSKSV